MTPPTPPAPAPPLLRAARGVLDRAIRTYDGPPDRTLDPARRALADARRRLDEPLRVALAGTVKSGKSTLLNALVGERVAPTDAAECTRVVTWYRDAPSTAVHRDGVDGRRTTLPFRRGTAGLEIDDAVLGPAADVTRLVVDWPSASLAGTTLIDTPGLDSLRAGHSARTVDFVTPDDRPSGTDVVVYLMRHAHRSDVGFLEAFAELSAGPDALGGVGAGGSVVVLARADEVGGGGLDALAGAGQVARAYREDRVLRPLCQTVVAVDGLLAETSRTLREREFAALRALARAPRADVDTMLRSADRFAREEPPAGVGETLAADPEGVRVDAGVRAALLDRFGVFGVRTATSALRRGLASGRGVVDSPSLAVELARRSGLDDLRETLRARVTDRRELHQARSALMTVELVLRRTPHPGAGPVAADLERVLAGAHEFVEERVLAALRGGAVQLPAEVATEAERLLGGGGPAPARRLGLEEGADADPARWGPVARTVLERWRVRAESPLTSRAAAEVARTVVRSLEGMVAGPGR